MEDHDMEQFNYEVDICTSDQGIEYRDEDIEIYISNKGGEKIRIKGNSFRIVARNANALYWVCDRRARKLLSRYSSHKLDEIIEFNRFSWKMQLHTSHDA